MVSQHQFDGSYIQDAVFSHTEYTVIQKDLA